MKKVTIQIALLSIVTLMFFGMSSCNKKTYYEEFREFENMGWNRFDDQTFNFQIEKTSGTYDVNLVLVFKEDFVHRTFTFDTRVITPGGEERSMSHKLHISKLDESTAEPAPDNTKRGTVSILKDYKFNETGSVQIRVQNRMTKMRTPGIVEIGLLVEK